VLEGYLPANAARLVKQWTLAHGDELQDNWGRRATTRRWSRSRDWTMIKVTKIKCLGGHRLSATFSDGMAGEYDFSAVIGETGPMIEPLRDPTFFGRVFLEDGAPTWPNGFDIAPEWLRREIEASGNLARDAAA
jgi:Protein of unknown function (DUF2442)